MDDLRDTDMADSKAIEGNGENPFGLSAAEWKFYQFVRASPKVTNKRKKLYL
jgi:hypothetical protein